MPSDEKQLAAYLEDAAERCARTGRPYFTKFLTDSEQALLKRVKMPHGVELRLFGGEANLDYERACIGLIPSEMSDIDDGIFPIGAVTFTLGQRDRITHRDVLGTLISVGIERDTIGDIYLYEDKAIAYLCNAVIPLVADTVTKIGGIGVRAEIGVNAPIPERKFQLLRLSVSSLRLDTMVGHLAGHGRNNAVEKYIRPQRVTVNSVVCTDADHRLKAGDKISVRGVGKFVFDEINSEGRKGSLHITVKKYI